MEIEEVKEVKEVKHKISRIHLRLDDFSFPILPQPPLLPSLPFLGALNR